LRELGEERALSKADVQVLALGLQLKAAGATPIIVSDDYAVQNVADRLNIEFKGLTTTGIKRRYRWITYCPGCKKTFHEPEGGNSCPVCGTELKRRPSTERKIQEGQSDRET
ncbi:MAG: hypothetical protein PVJ38_06505, partial [Candidatus Bathyarchaeota archaeon]